MALAVANSIMQPDRDFHSTRLFRQMAECFKLRRTLRYVVFCVIAIPRLPVAVFQLVVQIDNAFCVTRQFHARKGYRYVRPHIG